MKTIGYKPWRSLLSTPFESKYCGYSLSRICKCLFIIPFFSTYLCLAQQTLYFEKDGAFRYAEYSNNSKKAKHVKFIIENDSNAVYLMATSQAANYSLPGIGVKPKNLMIDDKYTNEPSKKKQGGKKNTNELPANETTWKVALNKGSEHLFYRIYKFPKELLFEEVSENISYNKLLFELNRKASVIVQRKRNALKNQLDALTFTEFAQLNKNYDSYKNSLSSLKEARNSLHLFLNSNDSLSIDDRILYNSIKAERNMYLREIERNEEFISTDNALEYLKKVREKYLSTLGEIAKYEAKKLTYRNRREKELRKEISQLLQRISLLQDDPILRNFLKAEKFLNETFSYSLDILYEGHITNESSTKEIEYNHQYNNELNTSLLERQTPILPKLSNRNYLSVVVHNVPGALMTKEGNIPFQLSLEVDSVAREHTRYNNFRTGGLKISQIDGQEGSLLRTGFNEIAQCDNFEKDVSNMKIAEIVTSSLISDNNDAKDSCLLMFEKKLVSTVKARDLLYESIKSYGDTEVRNATQPQYRDYVMTSGKRFQPGSIPTIVINTDRKENLYGNKVSVRKVAIVKDSLESVERLRRFGISTGLVMNNTPYYSQTIENIPGTSFSKLIEKKFTETSIQPVVFLSVYLKEQNLSKPARRAGSINIGIDYADGDLLDNFYLGYGIEPIRHFQIIIGVSAGRVDKVDIDTFDQLSSTFETKNEMAMGTFISANFYLSALPKIISPIFKK